MAVKFFGQFLLERGLVSKELLLKAIALQDETNLKFGATALSMGIISREDFERVHDAQRSEDLLFGDMAVKMGLLTENQVQQVLTKQKNNHIYIGEALVKVGALSKEKLSIHLREFKDDQAQFVVRKMVVPEGTPEPEIWSYVAGLTTKMITRVLGINFREMPAVEVHSVSASRATASMAFTGAVQGRYLFSVSEGMLKAVARGVLKEEDVENEPAEVLEDTVMEFVNIVCGNVVAKVAQMGKTMDILPPEVFVDVDVPVARDEKGILFPFHVDGGERMELALFIAC